MDEKHSHKKIRQALRRFVAEVAHAERVPADSARAARMAFFLVAGFYQNMTRENVAEDLGREIAAVRAANPKAVNE